MDAVRTLVSLGRAARDDVKIRVRQPLQPLYAVVPGAVSWTMPLLDLVRDELNVKDVRFLQSAEELVTLSAVPNYRVMGKRFGAATQQAALQIRALGAAELQRFPQGRSRRDRARGTTAHARAEEVEVAPEGTGELVVKSDAGFTVALDPPSTRRCGWRVWPVSW